MSNERSPRPSLSMTMGTSGMSLRSFAVVRRATGWLRVCSERIMQPHGCARHHDRRRSRRGLGGPERPRAARRVARRRRPRARRGGRAVRAARAVAVRGRRAGLAGRAAAGRRPGGDARGREPGAGRAVRARGGVSPEPDVFSALADPTRRTVLEEVATRGSATATELAQPLGVSRQAVAKHLGVLADAGLVDGRRAGRETRYRPTPAPMGEAISWMAEVGGRWDERLAALERSVARRRGARPRVSE